MVDNLKECRTHGTPDFPFQLYATRAAQGGWSVPVHWHPEAEVLRLHSGTLRVVRDGRRVTVGPGEVVFIGPGQLHGMELPPAGACYDAYVFPLELLRFELYDVQQAGHLGAIQKGRLGFPQTLQATQAKAACAILDELATAAAGAGAARQLLVRAQLLRLLALLVEEGLLLPPAGARGADDRQRQVKEMLAHIKQHSQQQLRLKDMAAAFGMTPKYFCHFFKKQVGRTFVDYINYLRVQQAADLLLHSQLKLMAVAMTVGYDNFSYFTRRFKRETGLTPSEYRRRGGWGGPAGDLT